MLQVREWKKEARGQHYRSVRGDSLGKWARTGLHRQNDKGEHFCDRTGANKMWGVKEGKVEKSLVSRHI